MTLKVLRLAVSLMRGLLRSFTGFRMLAWLLEPQSRWCSSMSARLKATLVQKTGVLNKKSKA